MIAKEKAWLRAYTTLALRVNRMVAGSAGGTILIYSGPAEWKAEVEGEPEPVAGRLVEDADRLLDDIPFEPTRAAYLAAHVRAMRAVARQHGGATLPLREYARECLGVEADWLPESVFEAAHAELDTALPAGHGSLSQRMHAWQATHALAPTDLSRLPELVSKAVTETRARTSAIVPLPAEEVVDCQVLPDAHFLAAGQYHGGLRSTLYLNGSLPFNLADLLYVVAHEGHPGHIAESVLKEIHLVEQRGFREQQVRFMLSPSFVVSEGIGLTAEDVAFPGGEGQTWLEENILRGEGIRPDGSNFAAIHRAKNALWGAWGNAAFLLAEGRPEAEVSEYLSRWGLLRETEVAAALGVFRAPGMSLYVLGYYHGWRLVGSWLDESDRRDRVRRLLTEQLLPADLTPSNTGN